MRSFKKMMALVVAMVMVIAMTLPAMAASITLKEGDTHIYKVYQVLTGTLSKEGSKQLGDPAWGADAIAEPGDVNAFITSITASGLSEAEIAALVAAKVDTTGDGRGTVTDGSPLTGLATGYYVLVDQTELTEDFKLDTKSLHVVQVLNDVTMVEIKYGTSEDVKTITADTLGKDEGQDPNTYDPGASNDNVSIGDTVTYNIAATVPDNADKFKDGTFFFVITDKLSTGLTFTDGSLEVYDGTTKLTEGTHYNVQYNINNNTFEVGLINAASYKGKTINVKYDAVLNENAVIGDAGNPNTSTVKFSNDPNKTYDGSPEDQQHPGFPDSTAGVPTGETPESKTITYSTGIEIQKVDENGEVLTGATFELSGQSCKKVVTKTESFEPDENGTYYKLKNGTYTMTPPNEGNVMIPAAAGATKGYVEDPEATGDDVITIDGTKYRPYVPATDSGKTLYVLDKGSKDSYESTTTKYKKVVTQKTVDSDVTDHKMTEAVDANGLARFDGLGAGDYTIKETVTPPGYNTLADLELTVTYNETGTAKFTVTGGNAVYEDGIIKITVENKKGSELPSTGGIGTTIFYVVGTILVLAAGLLLVTRRRMNA